MSFDLFLWDPPRAVDDAEVRARMAEATAATLAEAEDRAGPSLPITALCDEILRRYEPLESLSDDLVDDSPWSATPAREKRAVHLTIRWSRGQEMLAIVRNLARGLGLVLYDPQADAIVRPAPSPIRFRLSTYAGSPLEEPRAEGIADTVRALDADDWFALLERLDRVEQYVQCAITDDAAKLGLEWRDGHESRHYRCVVPREVAIEALVAFVGNQPLQGRFPWAKLTLKAP